MATRRAIRVARATAVLAVMTSAVTLGTASVTAVAGAAGSGAGSPPGAAAPAAGARAASALPAALTVAGPVTLEFSATTSDTQGCTGPCVEGMAVADFSSYSETASGKLSGTVNFAVDNGAVPANSGVVTESSDSFNASGDFTMEVSNTCGYLSGSGTEVAQGGTTPGTASVYGLSVIKNPAGKPDLQLDWTMPTPPVENTLITQTTTPCTLAPYAGAEDVAAHDLGLNHSFGFVTGWTINPDWTAAKGGTLATKTISGSAPQPTTTQANTGTATATVNFKLITKPAKLEITSPPDQSTIALTDPKYVTPQAGPDERAPKDRTLTVAGLSKCPGPVTVAGVSVPVSGEAWQAKVPVSGLGLGQVTLEAKAAGCGHVSSTVTLINLEITSPGENASLPITDAPAMPDLKAEADVAGYPGDTSQVSFDWTLDTRGETVTKDGNTGDWQDYSQPVANGSTTGSENWEPSYDNVVGGVGRLVVTASLPGVLDNPVTSDPRWINIPGTNPAPATAKKFVDTADPQYASTIRHIICIESDWQQFNPNADPRQPPVDNIPADFKPNPGPWQPLFGDPADIGIGQLDPAVLASPDQYWDWKANLLGAIDVFHDKLAQARQWASSEQARVDKRLTRILDAANSNRKAMGLQPIHKNPVTVPQLDDEQIRLQAIRLYNGGKEFHFNTDYTLARNNIDVVQTGDGKWVEGPAGYWGRAPGDLHDPVPWIELAKRYQDYVKKVLACKNS
jgi:hypothetical protein